MKTNGRRCLMNSASFSRPRQFQPCMDTSHEHLFRISLRLCLTMHAVGLIRETHVDFGMHGGARHISFDLDADWAWDVEG